MATTEIIGAKTYAADQRTIAVLREHSPEAAEALAMLAGVDTEGRPVPVSFHRPEHAAFSSEVMAALAELVAGQQRRIDEMEDRLAAGLEKAG